jgi:hypothetical protein
MLFWFIHIIGGVSGMTTQVDTQLYPAFTQLFLTKTRINKGIPSFTQNWGKSLLIGKKEKIRKTKNLFFLSRRTPVVKKWVFLGKSIINSIKTESYLKLNLGIFWV